MSTFRGRALVGWVSIASLGLALPACTGTIGGGDEDTSHASQASCDAGPSPLRRLTRREYDQTIFDLLGDDSAPASTFTPEAIQFGFDNGAAGATLSPVVIEQYETASVDLATNAIADLPKLLECDPEVEGEDACVAAFVPRFGLHAFRRPLAADEEQRFLDFYASSKASRDFPTAVRMLVSAFLQSPDFLYRVELGTADPSAAETVPLTPYEVASRLSYLLWGSMPDDALLDAAASGMLSTKEQIAEQARRMLDDDRGARVITNFFGQWVGARNLADLDRGDDFTPQIADLQRQELELFVDDVVRNGDGTLGSLLTSPTSFMNDELAEFYGLPKPGSSEMRRVELDPERYPGILTRGATMALLAHSGQPSIVLRGKFVLEQLLCETIPPPPDNVDTSLPDVDPNATARQQLEQKTAGQPCDSCHSVLNPPGFAFDHFDELGRWRKDEHGLPIDTSSGLSGTDVDGNLTGQADMAASLSRSGEVRDCMVLNWFRYTFGRDRTDADQCTVDDLDAGFAASGGNLHDLLIAVTQSDAFLYKSSQGGAQ